MRTLRLVTINSKLIRVDGVGGYKLKTSKNTSIVMATNNDYYHNIYESKFTGSVKYMREFYTGNRKESSLYDISSWFGRCWMSAYRYINPRSLSNLEGD